MKHVQLVLQCRREKKLAVPADEANMFVEQVEFVGQLAWLWSQATIIGKIACLEKRNKPGHFSVLLITTRNLSASIPIMRPLFTPCFSSPSGKAKGLKSTLPLDA